MSMWIPMCDIGIVLEAAISVTMDTLQHWSDTTNQPISLVASCHALEQLKLLSNNRDSDVYDRNFFTVAQKKVSNTACLGQLRCMHLILSAIGSFNSVQIYPEFNAEEVL